MAETQEQKSRRDQYLERLKARYPEKDYADDEAIFGQANDDYDEYERQLADYKGREDKLQEMFAKDPKNAQFIADMASGKDPWLAVIERLGIDGVTDLLNNPEKKEEYAEANKTYIEKLAKEKELEAEHDANLEVSLQMIDEEKAKRGLSDETIDAAWNLILQIAHEAIMGKITPETLDMALKATNHDADVENARTEGQIAGKNEKVEETLRKPKAGDGVPAMGGSNAAPTTQKRGFFDDLPKRKF